MAKAATEAGDDELTTVAVALGTPAYMSPEQTTGEANLDHLSDIYGLGASLHELPFPAKHRHRVHLLGKLCTGDAEHAWRG